MSRLEIIDDVVVFTPDRDAEARELARSAGRELPRVALFQSPQMFAPVPLLFGADAYVSHERALPAAIAWVKAEDRSARLRGPWRVVYVGSLGEDPVTPKTPIGKTALFGVERTLIGRDEGCAICLRQGPHSDGNTVARANTKLEIVNGALAITDLASTNGTRVSGREFSVGLGHHLRVDGGSA